jgi:hypothetical protein
MEMEGAMTLVEWSAILGNFGEFAGAILLFVSLIYVGVQIRQNTKMGTANLEQGLFEAQTNIFHLVLENPELITLAHDFLEGHGDDPAENARLHNFIMYAFTTHQHWFVQHKHGFLDSVLLDTYWEIQMAWLGNEPGSAWFSQDGLFMD